MAVRIKRIYDPVEEADGWRALVDRVWPRGISKDNAHLDEWLRELAPTGDLRKWFHHDPDLWDEFRRRYRAELSRPEQQAILVGLRRRAKEGPVTLLFGARDALHNQAVVLAEELQREH